MIACCLALCALVVADDLGPRIDAAVQDGLTRSELEPLAEEAVALAEGAGSRGDFWRAMSLVARLCAEAPAEPARRLRADALALLAARETDTLRWSALVQRAFLPPFERIESELRRDELAAYDRALVDALRDATSERARAEFAFARVGVRVHIDRRQDWLGAEERAHALALLAAVEREHGALPVAGGREGETFATRARPLREELTQLAFGAPAPPTSGSLLEGGAFDLADQRGSVVVLDFWTTFCQPCLALVPEARAILARLDSDRLVYVGVNGDEDPALGAATAKRVDMPWRNLWDGPRGADGPASRAWHVAAVGWPSVFVIDGEGNIRAKLRGKEQVERELEGTLRRLLAELD